MKKLISTMTFKTYLTCILVGMLPFSPFAQDDLIRARVFLSYNNINGTTKTLTATVKARIDRSYENIPNIPIDFLYKSDDEWNQLGSGTTNMRGEARIELPADFGVAEQVMIFQAAMEDTEGYQGATRELEIWPASLQVSAEFEDSVKKLKVLVEAIDSSEFRPAADVEIMIYVKRLFGDLPIAEDPLYTDESGTTEFEFPEGIPGEPDGSIDLITKVNDHELYGTLINQQRINWGVPTEPRDVISSRELWSARANAPLYLIISVNALLIGIWGIIVYIIFGLMKLKRLETRI